MPAPAAPVDPVDRTTREDLRSDPPRPLAPRDRHARRSRPVRQILRAARLAPRWYVGVVRRGPRRLLPGRAPISALAWLGLVSAPFLLVLGLVLGLAVRSVWWVVAGVVLAGVAAAPAAAITVLVSRVRRGRRVPSWATSRRTQAVTGRRGSSAEVKLSSAIGTAGRVRPATHAAVEHPRVTVVVACYNDAHFLGAALHSVQRQTVSDWQCVVVDDGSTDESFDVALLFAEVDARFEVVRHDRNRGLSAARNTGMARATGDYVTFLDSDDFLFRRSLESRLDAVVPDTACVGAYCDWRSAPENAGYTPESEGVAAERATVHLLTIGYQVPFIASAPIVRTDVLRATGGFDETLSTAEDADMWSRLLRGGVWLAYAQEIGVAYRQRASSMVRRSPLSHLDVVTGVAAGLDVDWQPWDGAPDPISEPLGQALRRMALLPRQLNFLALHVALYGSDGVGPEHLPEPELRSLPDYRDLVLEQSRRALVRLGRADEAAIEALASQVLAIAPPYESAVALDARPVDRAIRGRVLAAPVRRRDVAELHSGEPTFLLVPQSRYHIAEVGPLHDELTSRGVRSAVFVPPEAPVGVVRELSAYVDSVVVGDPEQLEGAPVTGVFVLNDWGPSTQAAIRATRAYGGTAFAKVEGVQDFQDADTGRIRNPYCHSDVVLGQGRNDVEALPSQEVVVVGSTRLEGIDATGFDSVEESRVLINFNFTYGVLSEAQDAWLWSAVEGARSLGLDYEISAHPSQKKIPTDAAIQDHLSVDPFSHALRRAGVLVSRFSTVLYESMALGVPVVYLNPHGEKVPTFQEPQGAFLKVTDEPLDEALRTALEWRAGYRARSDAFFRRQVDLDPDRTSQQRAADAIVARIRV